MGDALFFEEVASVLVVHLILNQKDKVMFIFKETDNKRKPIK
ncbi:hypothetical protein B834_2613 [Enterococcus mundtii 1A]|nr:hypothetical protein [Enterococcus mundtii 1A]